MDEEVAAARAHGEGMLFCEGSARTGAHIQDAFYLLTCEVLNARNKTARRSSTGTRIKGLKGNHDHGNKGECAIRCGN